MAHKSTFETSFRRKRQGKTNYRKRLELLKGKKPRLVIRKTNNNVIVQLVKFKEQGDETIASAFSKELEKQGWKAHKGNLSSAYLTGLVCGLKAKKQGVQEAVLDIGLATPVHGSVVFAALKGSIDAGLKVKADEKAFPIEERIKGKHIAEFALKLDEQELKRKFSKCFEKGLDPKNIAEHFEETKKKIMGEFG